MSIAVTTTTTVARRAADKLTRTSSSVRSTPLVAMKK